MISKRGCPPAPACVRETKEQQLADKTNGLVVVSSSSSSSNSGGGFREGVHCRRTGGVVGAVVVHCANN
jgi:hypothetical protein